MLDTPDWAWDKIFDVNVKNAFQLIQETTPYLEETKGNITCVSSIAGFQPMNLIGVYSVSKTALIGLVKVRRIWENKIKFQYPRHSHLSWPLATSASTLCVQGSSAPSSLVLLSTRRRCSRLSLQWDALLSHMRFPAWSLFWPTRSAPATSLGKRTRCVVGGTSACNLQ